MTWTCVEHDVDYRGHTKTRERFVPGPCDAIVTLFHPRVTHERIPVAAACTVPVSACVTGGSAPLSDEWEELRRTLETSGVVPMMRVVPVIEHRHRIRSQGPLFNAAVARPVPKKEALANKWAKQSLDDEWKLLRAVPQPGTKKKECWGGLLGSVAA